jgi:hypothetical protein
MDLRPLALMVLLAGPAVAADPCRDLFVPEGCSTADYSDHGPPGSIIRCEEGWVRVFLFPPEPLGDPAPGPPRVDSATLQFQA